MNLEKKIIFNEWQELFGPQVIKERARGIVHEIVRILKIRCG